MQRPTPGAALLSLWVEAGSRDAEPPQLAVAAAYWAGQKLGLTPRVLPEGTEFQTLCDTSKESLGACAARLVSVLDPAVASAKDVAQLRERLRAQRARAASDDARRAETLALQALLGESARGLFPLGNEADDARIEAGPLRAFIERHYAASRALLVGLGDVEASALSAAAKRMKQRTPAPRSGRAPLPVRDGLAVEDAGSGQLALVLATTSVERAALVCERFREIHGDARASISSVGDATLAHLVLPAGETPFARLQSAVFDLRRILLEPSAASPPPAPDSLEALARSIGEAWLSRSTAPSRPREGALGVALLWPRDDRALPAGNNTTPLEKVKERAAAAVDAGTRNSRASVHGDSSDDAARVTTGNGAHLHVVRRRGDAWFAAAVRFSGGAESDAATAHGRAALLATLMADGCGVATARGLDFRLGNLRAKLWPMVDATGLGVGISAPNEHAEEALDLLIRCALRPSFQARSVEDARARLVRSLWHDGARSFEAALGQLLAPAAPGNVAHWGTPQGVANVEGVELRRLHAQRTRGPSISVWVTADRPPAALTEFVARRLAHLSANAGERPEAQSGPSTDMAGALVEDARLRVVIGVHSAAGAEAKWGAEVFAKALERALASRVGAASESYGDSARERAFAGVVLTLREEQVDGLHALVDGALNELRSKPDAFYRSGLDALRLTQSAALSSARGYVEAAFAGREAGRYDAADELGLIRKLAKAQPSYLVLRPRP